MERSIRYLRGSFFEARRYRDLNDLNEQLRTWISETADARIVPDDPEEATVREAFEHEAFAHEQRLLLALPKHAFETRFVRAVKSGETPYIRFDKNDFPERETVAGPIPHTLIQKPLTVVASEHEVRVLDGTEEVARHARCWERHRQVECEEHLASLVLAKQRRTRKPLPQQAFRECASRTTLSREGNQQHLSNTLRCTADISVERHRACCVCSMRTPQSKWITPWLNPSRTPRSRHAQ